MKFKEYIEKLNIVDHVSCSIDKFMFHKERGKFYRYVKMQKVLHFVDYTAEGKTASAGPISTSN